MNERIKQLALDAGIGFTLWDDSGREMIDNYTPEEYLEKFAELIIQECINACGEDYGAQLVYQHWYTTKEERSKRLRDMTKEEMNKHFEELTSIRAPKV